MRTLVRLVGGLIALAVLFLAAIFAASEFGGEIVTLETRDGSGGTATTRLWVVDHDGSAWLRAGVGTSGWLARVEEDDRVRVGRAGQTAEYRAVPVRDPAVRDIVHDEMARKYGFADQIISVMRDGSQSIPVRLDPVAAP